MIVHIGAPKSGSSAVQKFLSMNRQALSAQGFYYPEHGMDVNGISGGHSQLGRLVRDDEIDAARALFLEQLGEARARGVVLLLSAEAFYGHPKRLGSVLSGTDARIVAFFRDPLEAVLSNYNQLVKRHFGRVTFDAYCNNMLRCAAKHLTGDIFADWASAFGGHRLQVLDYELSKTTPIEQLFLDYLGVDSDARDPFEFLQERVNGSYTVSALELKRLLNFVLDHDAGRLNHVIDWNLQRHSDASDEPRPALDSMAGVPLQERIRDQWSGVRERVLAAYGTGTHNAPVVLASATEGDVGPARSLAHVASECLIPHGDVYAYINEQVRQRIRTRGFSYETLRLAEIFHLDVGDTQRALSGFSARQIEQMVSPGAEIPDLLREMAMVLERGGRPADALVLVDRALELRPTGPFLQAMRDRLRGARENPAVSDSSLGQRR